MHSVTRTCRYGMRFIVNVLLRIHSFVAEQATADAGSKIEQLNEGNSKARNCACDRVN
jgi:hypothetical protein